MRYSAETTASPTAALILARAAFGSDGAGLRISAVTLTSARFSSSVGFVAVELQRLPSGATEVVVETREFDAEARRFLLSLPRQAWLTARWRALRSKIRPNARP